MKIAILIPFYKYMDALAVQSLVTMLADIHDHGDVYVQVFCHSLYIEKARSLLFKTVTENVPDADYVLCIDTDHVYSAKVLYALIERMEKEELALLSAAYRARGMVEFYAHCKKDESGAMKKIPYTPLSGVIDCDSVGFGFLVLRGAYVRRVQEKHGSKLFDGGLSIGGEDLQFCKIAKEDGTRIAFDADQKVGHISTYAI